MPGLGALVTRIARLEAAVRDLQRPRARVTVSAAPVGWSVVDCRCGDETLRVVRWPGEFAAPVAGGAAVLIDGVQASVLPPGGGHVIVHGCGTISLEWRPA